MTKYIAILRGINVSGQKKILMADLKTLFENLKFANITTYIQSGNVVFDTSKKQSNVELALIIEKAILKQYSFEVPVIVRSAEEFETIVSNNPFLKDKKTYKNISLDKLHVTFLASLPDPKQLEVMNALDYSPDKFIIMDTEVYLHIPESYGETKLSNKFIETKLKVSATTRNWNTVNKLVELSNIK